jgi:hypothetical protein
MGASALKGMAFSKPLVVQGAQGFWRLLTPHSQDQFLSDGFFGHGGAGAADLEQILVDLLTDADRRLELGAFGRNLVEDRFDVARSGQRLSQIYAGVANRKRQSARESLSLVRTTYEYLKFRTSLQLQAVRRDPARVLAHA